MVSSIAIYPTMLQPNTRRDHVHTKIKQTCTRCTALEGLPVQKGDSRGVPPFPYPIPD